MDSSRRERNNKKKKKGSTKTKLLLIVVAGILALLGLGGGYAVGMLNKMERVDLDKDKLGINNELTSKYEYIKNIALFGVDSTEGDGRSDSMMVATIDTKHKKVKVTSLMRDIYVEIPGFEDHKLNSAYAFGKEETAIKTINQTFDLNIEDFVTVDFRTLPQLVDFVGGIEMELDKNEAREINQHIAHLNTILNKNSALITQAGTYQLDGVQAMAFCRIRSTPGDDFKRTERQREVLGILFGKMLDVSPTKYPKMLNDMLPLVKTSLSTSEILSMGTDVASIGGNLEQGRFPVDGDWDSKEIKGMSCLTFDKEATQQKIHDWIFEDINPNEPSNDED
ncbi:MAG: LCP family protein [Sarcina sp.]